MPYSLRILVETDWRSVIGQRRSGRAFRLPGGARPAAGNGCVNRVVSNYCPSERAGIFPPSRMPATRQAGGLLWSLALVFYLRLRNAAEVRGNSNFADF